jgi:hypothetical protein
MIVPHHSRWATQSGIPAASASQKKGPIGHRKPMYWWVTVPSPIDGSHIDQARLRSLDGSRYR